MDASDYKSTTHLPRTEFAMKANLPQREPAQVARWREAGTYARMLATARGQPFVLHDGPPYANGHIHQGHMLNKVLKDVVGKHRTMTGRPARIVPGWDCHGLPIELAVDKALGPKKREMDKVAIRRECRRHAEKFIEIQRREFERLGVFMDWDHPYTTMSYGYEAEIVRQLARVVRAGEIYRGKKPVYWCVTDRTALAEAEVEYEDHESPSIYVAFSLVPEDRAKVSGAPLDREIRLAVWTTTPWTLPANLAVAVHPSFEYVLYDLGGKPTLVAKELLLRFLAAVAPAELTQASVQLSGAAFDTAALAHPERILGYMEGAKLEGLRYRHPLFDRVSPVIVGEHVTLEAGTGLVHTAPGHGQEDYDVGRRYGLAPFAPVDAAGRFTAEAGPFAGKQIFEANPEVTAALEAAGALLNRPGETLRHSYPHCWRCKRPVIFRATDQWFVSMEQTGLRARALEAVKEVRWIPAWGEDRITAMLERRPDWCISRQRAWGVPIPAVYCEGCGEALLDPVILDRVADRFEREGADAWFVHPVEELLPPGHRCPRCGGAAFRKEEDILDVWFDSGVSQAVVLGRADDLPRPADLYLEGSDQHRGWFQSTLLCALAAGDPQKPFRECLTHGFVVDGEGRKLSKSLGNYLEPEKLLAQQGAEIVRLWAAAEDYRDDIRLSDEIVARLADSYRKLRNTLRYGLSNLYDFDPARQRVEPDGLLRFDRYLRSRLHRFVREAGAAYDAYEIHRVYRGAVDFCAVELSSLYFDVIKDRLYCSARDSRERRAAQTVVHEIVETLCRLLAPILSFTCEEAYGHLPGRLESVFVAGIPSADERAFDPALEASFDALLGLRTDVRRELEGLRRDKAIGSSQEARVSLWLPEGALQTSAASAGATELAELFIVSEVSLQGGAPPANAKAGETTGAFIRVETASGARCARCWNHRPAVGEGGVPLCARCRAALEADGRTE